jgi:hypothetical protein
MTTYDFTELAPAAAHYWLSHLSPRVTRPVGLYEALVSAIISTQSPTPQPVLLCSRPEAYHTQGYTGVNVLALVAYHYGIKLESFTSALVVLHPELAPSYYLHPDGIPRALLEKYPLETSLS